MTDQMPRTPEPEVMDGQAEAEAYAETDFSEVNQAFVDRLLAIVGPLDEAHAVDLGTGPGDIPLRVLKARPAWQVVAVDASPAMLEAAGEAQAAAGIEQGIQWLLADAKATGLAADSVDVIFSNSILHHINDAGKFWAEVRRLARPGATVLLRDLARPTDEAAARRIVDTYAGGESELLRKEYYDSLLAAYTPAEVREQLARAGLRGLTVSMVTDRHLDVVGRLT